MRLPVIIAFVFFLAGHPARAQGLDSLFSIARQHIYQSRYTEAVTLYEECLRQSRQQRDLLKIGNAFIGIGVAHERSGNYEAALNHYFQAATAYEQAGNEEKRAGTLKNIGNVYRILKSFDRSYAYFQLALDIRQKIRDSTGLANVLNDLGVLFMDKDSSRQAIAYFGTIIRQYDRYAAPEVQAYALNNLAICYSKLQAYSTAYNYYTAALAKMQQLQNRYGIALVYQNLGDLYNRQQDYNKGIAYCRQSAALADSLGSKELLLNAYKYMAWSYLGLQDFKQAAAVLQKQLVLKDSVFKDESARSYAEMETRFQTERKQKEILLLQKEATIRNAALTTQQRTKYFLLVVLVLIGVVAALLYRSALLKQRSNTSLALLNGKLHEANASKVKLLSILSHDLRSPISSLFSFLHLRTENAKALSASEQHAIDQKITASAENLLDAMEDLLIWSKSQMEHFTPVSETVFLSPFLDEIINLHSAAAATKKIMLLKSSPEHLYLHTDPNFLKIILRNLTSNAIKFTPPGGTIRLAAEAQEGHMKIKVSDDGPGISPEELKTLFEWNSIRSDSSGLGLKLVKEFTEKLNASVTVQSQPGQGTTFTLLFPA